MRSPVVRILQLPLSNNLSLPRCQNQTRHHQWSLLPLRKLQTLAIGQSEAGLQTREGGERGGPDAPTEEESEAASVRRQIWDVLNGGKMFCHPTLLASGLTNQVGIQLAEELVTMKLKRRSGESSSKIRMVSQSTLLSSRRRRLRTRNEDRRRR